MIRIDEIWLATEPLAEALHQWMLEHRQKVPDGSGTAKALDYSLKRWEALTRYLDDGALPIDNNWGAAATELRR